MTEGRCALSRASICAHSQRPEPRISEPEQELLTFRKRLVASLKHHLYGVRAGGGEAMSTNGE